jgi:sarcosine oxidase subunit gamma
VPERYHWQGPLAHLQLVARAGPASEDAGVTLAELAPRGLIDLRGDPAAPAFRDAAQRVLGVVLPMTSNTAAASAGITAFWLGPDEWLVAAPFERAAGLLSGLREVLAGQHHALVDLSHARTTLALAGPQARDVLAKGCPLDLHPRVFAPGRCAQSHLAKAGVLIYQADDRPTFHLTVWRSYAEYVWLWLEDAAKEYGFAVVEG